MMDGSRGTAVILTALGLEYAAVRAHLGDQLEEREERGTLYELGTFTGRRGTWTVAIAETGEGNSTAGIQVERAIQTFAPQVVLFVGVAGGRKDVELGDVVAADAVYDYEAGKDTKARYFPRIKTAAPSYALVQRARAVARQERWQHRIKAPATGLRPTALVKPIAAGGKVVGHDRSRTARLLAQSCGDAVAVDMESHGFLHGAYANAHTSALAIRGISDLLTGKNEADDRVWQPLAARHAAAFAFELLADVAPTVTPGPGDGSQTGAGSSTGNWYGGIHHHGSGDIHVADLRSRPDARRRLDQLSSVAARDAELLVDSADIELGPAVRLDDQLYVPRKAEREILAPDALADRTFRKLIVGEAGYGKTSLLWRLNKVFRAREDWACWLLKASLLARPSGGSGLGGPMLDQTLNDLRAAVPAVHEQGRRPLVLLDTIDLMLHTEADRDALLLVIEELRNLGCALIATCRIREARRLDGALGRPIVLPEYDDDELDDAIRRHAERFYVNQIHREENVRLIRDAVANGRPLTEVCRNPLTLRMLFSLYAPETVPREINVFQLYREYWTQRVVEDHRGGTRVVSGSDDLTRTAMAVALTMFAEGTPEPSRADVREAVGRFGGDPLEIDGLASRGVVLQSETGKLQFFHQTFFEHAAGLALAAHWGPEGLRVLLDRTAEQPANLFLFPVLEQALLSAAAMPQLREPANAAFHALLDRDSLAARTSAVYVYAHQPSAMPETHELIVEVLARDPAAADRFILVAPNLPAERLGQLFECLATIWRAGRWDDREHIIEVLERLALRAPERTQRFLEDERCLATALVAPSSGIATARKLVRPLVALARHDLEWSLARLAELWRAGIDRARSRELQVAISEALYQGVEAGVVPEPRIATRLEQAIPEMNEDQGAGTSVVGMAVGRLWALEWRMEGRSRDELLDDLLDVDALAPDHRFRVKVRMNGLAELSLGDSAEVAEATTRQILTRGHPELRWLWSRIVLASLFSGRLVSMHLVERRPAARFHGSGRLEATAWARRLATQVMSGDERGLTSLLPGVPAARLGRLVREGLRQADVPRAELLEILGPPALQEPGPWLVMDFAGPFLVDGYLGGHPGATRAMAELTSEPGRHPDKLVHQVLKCLVDEPTTDPRVVGVLVSVATRTTAGRKQLLRALERTGKDAAGAFAPWSRALDALWRRLTADRAGTNRRTGTLLCLELVRLGICPPPDLSELIAGVRREHDLITRQHLVRIGVLGVLAGMYPAGTVRNFFAALSGADDPGTRETVLMALTQIAIFQAEQEEAPPDDALHFATEPPVNGGRFALLEAIAAAETAHDPDAGLEVLARIGRTMCGCGFGSRARSIITRALRRHAIQAFGEVMREARVRFLRSVPDYDVSFAVLAVDVACYVAFDDLAAELDELLADERLPARAKESILRAKYFRQRTAGGGRWAALYDLPRQLATPA